VYKLSKDGYCEYDEFEKTIQDEGTCTSELITIQARLQEMAELKSMPKEKFKDITENSPVKEYEIKTKHLRLYLMHEQNTGRVIISGSKKTSQDKDIRHFRILKQEYIDSKK